MSGAQIVAVVAWLSVLAAPWYAAIAGTGAREIAGIAGVSALIGTAAGLYHAGTVARQRRAASSAIDEMKQAAVDRIRRGA